MTLLGVMTIVAVYYLVIGILSGITAIKNGSFAHARVLEDGRKVSAVGLFALILALWPWFMYLNYTRREE